MKLSSVLPALTARIAPLDTPERRTAYSEGRFPRSAAVKDLDTRYRWDLFYAARPYDLIPDDVTHAHIDTALRHIVAPINA